MIVKLVVAGLAVVGGYTACRCVHQKVANWLKPHSHKEAERQSFSTDATLSFTVDLVRTVLEHQARREDESRQQLTVLLMHALGSRSCSAPLPFHFLETESTPAPNHNETGTNTEYGMVARTIRCLFPARRRQSAP
jgi:hypothetical protein